MQEKRQNIAIIKSRILDYLDYKGIKRPEFCRNSGISESLFKGTGLKSEIGGEKLVSILTFYNEINPVWLLTGRGNKILDQESDSNMNCYDCPLRDDIERYQQDIDRYRNEIDYLNSELRTLRQQNTPEPKRRSA